MCLPIFRPQAIKKFLKIQYQIGQGHPRAIIYTTSVELHSVMLHTKFQDHWPSGSREEDFFKFFFSIYSHCGHLGHVTLTII